MRLNSQLKLPKANQSTNLSIKQQTKVLNLQSELAWGRVGRWRSRVDGVRTHGGGEIRGWGGLLFGLTVCLS